MSLETAIEISESIGDSCYSSGWFRDEGRYFYVGWSLGRYLSPLVL